MARPRSIQNALITVVIVVELIVLVGHPLFGWGPSHHRPAATPPTLAIGATTPPSAAAILRELSAVAARPPNAGAAPPLARYAYVRRREWQLADQLVGGERVDHPLPRTISTWRAADGSGRAVVLAHTRHGETTSVSALSGAIHLPALTGGAGTLDHRLGLHRGVSTETALRAFAGLAAEEPIPGAAESEILRLLAGDAGLTNAGSTLDRDGRAGIALQFTAAAPSSASPAFGPDVALRDTLVFDPRTGALLEFDTALAGPPGHLDVPSGALLSYTLYLQSGRVARPGERPSASG